MLGKQQSARGSWGGVALLCQCASFQPCRHCSSGLQPHLHVTSSSSLSLFSSSSCLSFIYYCCSCHPLLLLLLLLLQSACQLLLQFCFCISPPAGFSLSFTGSTSRQFSHHHSSSLQPRCCGSSGHQVNHSASSFPLGADCSVRPGFITRAPRGSQERPALSPEVLQGVEDLPANVCRALLPFTKTCNRAFGVYKII